MLKKLPINWHSVEVATLTALGTALTLSISATNILLVFALLLLARRVAADPGLLKRSTAGVTIPLAVYLLFDFSAVFLSGYPAHVIEFFEDKWVLAAYFAALGLADTPALRLSALYGVLTGAAIMAAYSILQFFTGFDYLRGVPLEEVGSGYMAVGVFSHHLTWGGIALIAFILALSHLLFANHGRIRYNFILLTILTGCGLITSYARSAFIGAAAAIAVLWAVSSGRIKTYIFAGSIIAGFAVLIFVPGMFDRSARVFSSGDDNEGSRIRLWLTSIEIIKHHPMFGVGQSNFGAAFERYRIPGEYENAAHPHCDLLSVAVDGGIVALAAFIWVWIVFYRRAMWNINRMPTPPFKVGDEKGESSDVRLRVAVSAVVTGILAAGLFQNYQSDAEVAALMWFMVGLAMAAAERSQPRMV